MSDGLTRLTAVSIEEIARRHAQMRFPPPMIEHATDPEGFDYWWSQLQFVFPEVTDPAQFPALPAIADAADAASVRRYVEIARILARSSQLSAAEGVEVSLSRESLADPFTESVESSFSPPDHSAGFAAYFRQLYSGKEHVAFNNVMRVLLQAAASRQAAAEELKVWGRMVRRLRSQPFKVLLLERLGQVGLWGPLTDDDRRGYAHEQPERLISKYLHGEHLHSDASDAASAGSRGGWALLEALNRMAFHETMAVLAHTYIGFAVVAERATRVET